MKALANGRTSITIAHKIQTIKSCEIIYVVEKGSVKEKGSFYSLERFKNVEIEEENNVNSLGVEVSNDILDVTTTQEITTRIAEREQKRK